MRPAPRHLALALLCCLAPSPVLLSSCGGSSPPPRALVVTGIDALVASLAESACEWQERCCSPIELEQAGRTAEKAACIPHAKLALTKAAASLRFGIAQGLIELEDKEAKACAEAQRTKACNSSSSVASNAEVLGFDTFLQDCLYTFKGKVLVGGRCEDPTECIAGTHCATVETVSPPTRGDGGISTGPRRDTICLADQKRGDACQTDGDCSAKHDDYCRHPDLRCAARAAEGEECGFVETIDPFLGLRQTPSPACAAGLHCAGGVCIGPAHEGETCLPFQGAECDPDPALDLACIGGSDGAGVCAPTGKEGDACGTPSLPPCKGGLTCNLPGMRGLGTCGPAPKVGEPCSLDPGCASPARCLATTQRCAMPGPKAEREACVADTDCASLTCSFPGDGVCVGAPGFMLVRCSGNAANVGTAGGFVGGTDGGPGPSFDGGRFPFPFADAGADIPPVLFDAPPVLFDASVGETSGNEGDGPTSTDGGTSSGG